MSKKLDLNNRLSRVLVSVLALAATYVVAIRAIDSGHLWQYALVLALAVFGINRLISAIRIQKNE